MGPENTHGIFLLAGSRVLTSAIVSQVDTTECGEKVLTLQPTSVHRKPHKIHQQKRLIDLLDRVLKVKTRSAGKYKVPPP